MDIGELDTTVLLCISSAVYFSLMNVLHLSSLNSAALFYLLHGRDIPECDNKVCDMLLRSNNV